MSSVCAYLVGGIQDNVDEKAAKLISSIGGLSNLLSFGTVATVRCTRSALLEQLKNCTLNSDKIATTILALEANVALLNPASVVAKSLMVVFEELRYQFLLTLVTEITIIFAKFLPMAKDVKLELEKVSEILSHTGSQKERRASTN